MSNQESEIESVEYLLDGVALKAAQNEDTKPVWIQLAKPGAFRGHPAGPFELNEGVFTEIIRNFRATENRAIPIDFEHASEADPTQGAIPTDGAPAQGWIRDLKIEGGNLWGLVEWLPKARDLIRAGQYKFFSPAIRFGARDRVTGQRVGARMTSGALTNNPFLDGMKPLAAKDTADASTVLATENAKLTLTLQDREAQIRDREAQIREREATIGMRDAAIVALGAEIETLRGGRDATVAGLRVEVKTLSERLMDIAERDLLEEVEIAFATYKDTKGLTDRQKESMLTLLRHAPGAFRDLYPRVQTEHRHLMRNLTDRRVGSIPEVVDSASRGVGSETVLQATKRLMRDEKLSYEDAQIRALTEREGLVE